LTGATVSTTELSRLRWRCRRGMRELDRLLERYLEQRFAAADLGEREAFAALLELPDPVIFGYLIGRDRPENEAQSNVVERIRTTGLS
jgi:antitoxin CptB